MCLKHAAKIRKYNEITCYMHQVDQTAVSLF